MNASSANEFMDRVWRLQSVFASFTFILVAAAIAVSGDPSFVVGAAVIGFSMAAIVYRHASIAACALVFIVVVAMVEELLPIPAPFTHVASIATSGLFALMALVGMTNWLREETGISLWRCFAFVLPVGRAVGIFLALLVLANPAARVVASVAGTLSHAGFGDFGLRAAAILALALPIALLQFIKWRLKPLYVVQASPV